MTLITHILIRVPSPAKNIFTMNMEIQKTFFLTMVIVQIFASLGKAYMVDPFQLEGSTNWLVMVIL